ncbi:MAG: LysM peptidoglycan-binding domain-containing protein [Mycobacterium leprae]
MQIHVVQPNQSLFGIAQAYDLSVATIARANQLNPQQPLVVGQALVIPIVGEYYWVRPGDSLWSIARRFGIAPGQLARVNRLPPAYNLPVGFRLYIPARPKRNAEANAYVEPMGPVVIPELTSSAQEAAPYLTYLSPFSFRIRRDGSLEPLPLDNFPAIARSGGASLVLVVSNQEEGKFSAELGRIILNDPQVREALLNNILRTARELGVRDVHFDLEFLRPEDKDAYTRFLREAAARLHAANLLLSTALAPKVSATEKGGWYEAHDYRAHGQIVDFVVIMTYEWGYSGGPPLAVSPLPEVRRVLNYALTEIPAGKIMMGQNLYGYDWTLPYVQGGPIAKVVSPQDAIDLARRQGVAIQYDTRSQAPTFRYTDDAGRTHEVWFEDARSIQAKFDLIKELGLRGISYWKLGLPFPQNWLLLTDNFNIVKRTGR